MERRKFLRGFLAAPVAIPVVAALVEKLPKPARVRTVRYGFPPPRYRRFNDDVGSQYDGVRPGSTVRMTNFTLTVSGV